MAVSQRLNLNFEEVEKAFAEEKEHRNKWDIGTLQVVLYVMVGGGMIGRMYAEQPADAYIDTRVGQRPYSIGDIEQARKCLVAMATAHGLNPHRMPAMPNFHACGIF